MSINSRITKKQRRDFKFRLDFNNGADREIRNWKLIDVHQVPLKIEYESQFDFWCHNKIGLFLLSLRKSKIEKYFISKPKGREQTMNLIAAFDFTSIDNNAIKKVLDKFERKGIPKYTINKMHIKFQ